MIRAAYSSERSCSFDSLLAEALKAIICKISHTRMFTFPQVSCKITLSLLKKCFTTSFSDKMREQIFLIIFITVKAHLLNFFLGDSSVGILVHPDMN